MDAPIEKAKDRLEVLKRIDKFNKEWAIVTAGNKEKFNC